MYYMGETQETWMICKNGQNPHFKYHLQLKTKENVEGNGWDFKGDKAIHMEMEKQMFD